MISLQNVEQNSYGSQFQRVAITPDEMGQSLKEGPGNGLPSVVRGALERAFEAVGDVDGQTSDVVKRADDGVGVGVEYHHLTKLVKPYSLKNKNLVRMQSPI